MLVRTVRRATGLGADLVDRVRERRNARRWSGAGHRDAALRLKVPFARDEALSAFGHETEIEGRRYTYVLYPGSGDTLCVHYSAFFGEWGDRHEHRAQFQGHFHRLRMFWPLARHHFLFLCDTFGADANGTYYKGESADFFVERAVEQIRRDVAGELGIGPERTVLLGSSMGATAAVRFALRDGLAGAIGVSPHLDLDLSAVHQGRRRHVAAALGREDVESPDLFPVTREIRDLVATVPPTPRIVLQSMADDRGVHAEQVLPFVEAYRARGGWVELDEHPVGGHTSEYATADWFAERIEQVLAQSRTPT